jgi:hypothetical protein
MRERVERGVSSGSHYSPSLYVGPMGPVDDAEGVPAPLPCETCDVRLNKTGGVGPRRARRAAYVLTRWAV